MKSRTLLFTLALIVGGVAGVCASFIYFRSSPDKMESVALDEEPMSNHFTKEVEVEEGV
ncbi:hypothetical protein [Pelagicoccus sp. SDUM812002]|uniref:hypothetical protein n=1 Tax=Pelagicoccus sp. SDUM812002 TaxID=3041266 RepID=UPI002810027A|nr:hypothetical protein [Pelagicoccus sp. SDUM812002]MDQ8186822.1 hypothetical protein [Pelagicoccus sp. SDUM812002]